MLQPTQIISLNRLAVPETESPRSEILLGGKSTGVHIEGAYLEAALSDGQRFLVFTTCDCPFEESLIINLLDSTGQVIDNVGLWFIYATGIFEDLRIESDHMVSFLFFGGIRWQLQLFDAPQFCVPWLSEPRGAHREFGFKRWMKLIAKPLPEA